MNWISGSSQFNSKNPDIWDSSLDLCPQFLDQLVLLLHDSPQLIYLHSESFWFYWVWFQYWSFGFLSFWLRMLALPLVSATHWSWIDLLVSSLVCEVIYFGSFSISSCNKHGFSKWLDISKLLMLATKLETNEWNEISENIMWSFRPYNIFKTLITSGTLFSCVRRASTYSFASPFKASQRRVKFS